MAPIFRSAALVAAVSAIGALAAPAPAIEARQSGAPTWASQATATIHPGVNTNTAGSCTSNFIYYQGSDVYIGQAAHCSSTGESTSTNGCTSGTLPEGSRVNITGAAFPGKMVYNSWARMQRRGETDENTCAYNDLALVLIDPRDVSKVNPTVPYFGGPSGERQGAVSNLEQVVSYGNSILRAGITFLSPKFGTQISSDGDGWSHGVYTVTPGIPGDSGSGFMDNKGAAFGVLSTLQFAPVAGSNGVGDLQKELAYARTFSDFSGITLAKGTAAFRGALNLAGAGDLLKAPSPAIAASKKSVSLRQL